MSVWDEWFTEVSFLDPFMATNFNCSNVSYHVCFPFSKTHLNRVERIDRYFLAKTVVNDHESEVFAIFLKNRILNNK